MSSCLSKTNEDMLKNKETSDTLSIILNITILKILKTIFLKIFSYKAIFDNANFINYVLHYIFI